MDTATEPGDNSKEKLDPAFSIVPLKKELEDDVVTIIRHNLDSFEEAGSVLAASFRRLGNFFETYALDGSIYLVIIETKSGAPIGGAGIGPMAGLPLSEAIGEIRELVIDSRYRKQGLGSKLLLECIKQAQKFKYKRLYLETTKQMEHAQRLFQRFGFVPIEQKNLQASGSHPPCYYMREMERHIDIDE